MHHYTCLVNVFIILLLRGCQLLFLSIFGQGKQTNTGNEIQWVRKGYELTGGCYSVVYVYLARTRPCTQFLVLLVLRMESKFLCMLCLCSIIELHPQPYHVVLHSLYVSIYVMQFKTQKMLLKQYSQTSYEQVPFFGILGSLVHCRGLHALFGYQTISVPTAWLVLCQGFGTEKLRKHDSYHQEAQFSGEKNHMRQSLKICHDT